MRKDQTISVAYMKDEQTFTGWIETIRGSMTASAFREMQEDPCTDKDQK